MEDNNPVRAHGGVPKLIAVESRYAGDVAHNEAFARNVCRGLTRMGHYPYAMHLFFTQFLDDTVPADRSLGIAAGLQWTAKADEHWFCFEQGTPRQLSRGMMLAYEALLVAKQEVVIRFVELTHAGLYCMEYDTALSPTGELLLLDRHDKAL